MVDPPENDALVCTRRGLERAAAVVRRELGCGVTGLLAIACTAPLLGMFGTVVLLINALRAQSLPGFAECDCAGGLAETFVPFALSLPVTIFAGGALHYLTRKLESFDLEMRLATLNLLDHLASQCCGRR